MKRTAADSRWSKAVRERDGYRCQRCGTQHATNSMGLHAAHVFSRGVMRIRHDIDNGISYCYGCHSWFDSRSKEEKAEIARAFMGNEKYEVLLAKKNAPRKRIILTEVPT